MAVGRISGPLLKSNLVRNGIDLAFETDLLYLDVANNRVGINNSNPQFDLDVIGTTRTQNFTVTGGTAEMAGIKFENNTLSTTASTITLGTLDNVLFQKKLRVGDIDIDSNVIQTNTSNSNLELRPNGTGKVIVDTDMDVQGNIHATGNISADGNITLGDANTDDVVFQGEVASNIVPDADNTYTLGTPTKRWKEVNSFDITATNLNVTTLTSPGVDFLKTHQNMLYVAENGSDSDLGNHPQSPFGTIKHALSQASSGDVVHVFAGEYTEIFPLTVPQGVTLRGQSLRSVNIKPTVQSEFNDAFLLNGESTIEELTVKDFYSGGKYFQILTTPTTNTFTVNIGTAPQAHTYVSGGTVDSDDSTVATITNAVYDNTSGLLTVTTSSAHGRYIGNFVFLKDLTFNCSNGNKVYPNNGYAFRFATDFEVTSRSPYIRNITVITKGKTTSGSDPRGFLSGDAGKGAYVDGSYATANSKEASMLFHSATFITPGVDAISMTNGVRVEWLNSFTYFANRSIYGFDSNLGIKSDGKTQLRVNGSPTFNAGETITYYDTDGTTVLATGTIESKSLDDKIFIDGKVTGFEEATTRSGKTLTANGDAQLSTAQKKFGTTSLLLDGTGDYVSLASSNDFGFGTGAFSINFWVRLDAIGGTAQNLLDMRAGSASDTAVRLYTTSGNLYFDVGGTAQITANSALSATTFHHIVIDRSGTSTKLFVDGTQVGTYSDSNNYGNIKPLVIGAAYDGSNATDGHIDDFRVVKGTSIYQSAFSAPSSRHPVTSQTVLMARFDGTNGATTFEDDATITQDIRFSGGATADGFTLVDYTDFGAEIRSIGSASVYGNFGLFGDGPGVIMYAIGHNLGYIGTGAGEENDPGNVIQLNEVTQLNGAKVRFNSVDHKGDFRVGDLFHVNQEDGTVTFTSANFNINTNSGLTFTTGSSNTIITGEKVETGNLILSGNTLSSSSGNIILDAADKIQFVDDVDITGNLDVSGDVTIGGNITFGDSSNDSIQFVAGIDSDLVPSIHNTYSLGTFTDTWSNLYVSRMFLDDFEIDTNVIKTTQSNADLELRANGTGKVRMPANNVKIDNDLTVTGTTTLSNLVVNGNTNITGNSTQTGNLNITGNTNISQDLFVDESAQFDEIKIENNVISTTTTNADMEIRASGTGRILIPDNDVVITNNLEVAGDLIVNSASGATGEVTASAFTTDGILIETNFITTTESNSDLELRTSGTGDILLNDDIKINFTTISTMTGDLTLAPDDGNVNINSTGAVKLPVGTTAQRPTPVSGQMRFNSETNNFEGYNGTSWSKFTGLEDLDGDTKITPELTPGANDDTIRFIIQNNTVANLTKDRFQVNKLAVDDIEIDGNRISTVTTDTDLELDAQGTGQVKFSNFGFNSNQITNLVSNSVTEFRNTNNGYVKFAGTYGLVIPVGDNTNKPGAPYVEEGMIRWNTADGRVEVYDGTSWGSVVGTSGGISFADAEDLAISLAISLG